MNQLIKKLVESFIDNEDSQEEINLEYNRININDFKEVAQLFLDYPDNVKLEENYCDSQGEAYVTFFLSFEGLPFNIDYDISFTYSYSVEITNYRAGSSGSYWSPPEDDEWDGDAHYEDFQIFVDGEELTTTDEIRKPIFKQFYKSFSLDDEECQSIRDFYEKHFTPDNGYYD